MFVDPPPTLDSALWPVLLHYRLLLCWSLKAKLLVGIRVLASMCFCHSVLPLAMVSPPQSSISTDSKPQFKSPFSLKSFQNPPLASIPWLEEIPFLEIQGKFLLFPCAIFPSSFCAHLWVHSVNIYYTPTICYVLKGVMRIQ